jgi:hypothetical protein
MISARICWIYRIDRREAKIAISIEEARKDHGSRNKSSTFNKKYNVITI